MSEWKEVRLGNLCYKVCSGGTPKSTCSTYYDGGTIPWLNTKEINYNRISATESYITEEGLNNSSAKWIDANSVIVAMYGATAGRVAIAKVPMTTNQACCNLMIDSSKADYNFIYYYLSNSYKLLLSMANGAAQQNLNAQVIKDFIISMPDIEEQHRIASILSSLDDKIAVNRRICENLEAQAQALFKHWFIDFAPFKDGKFVESELGMIPEGWKVGRLEDICAYSNEKVAVGSLNEKSYFSTENMLPNKAGAEDASSLPQVEMTTSCMPFDVLVSNIRPYFKKIIRVSKRCGCSTDVLCFHPNKSKYNSFLYRLLYDDSFFAYAMSGSKGTKMPRGDKSQIMRYPIVLPIDTALVDYSKIAEPMFELAASLKQESSRLSTLRDTLLPKLMSGQIKV